MRFTVFSVNVSRPSYSITAQRMPLVFTKKLHFVSSRGNLVDSV